MLNIYHDSKNNISTAGHNYAIYLSSINICITDDENENISID